MLLPSMCTCLLLVYSSQGQPGLGVPAMLGAHGVWRTGGQEDLEPSFCAVFGKAGQAQAPCTGVSGLCRRPVACVALGRDTLLGKLCPCTQEQSPALARLWGGRAGHWAQLCHVLSTPGQACGRVLLPGWDEYWGGAHGISPELFESPLLESEEEHLLLDPGNTLQLYCDANQSGASVVWYKESRLLVPGGRIHLRQSLLEISEVAYEDSGLYVCRARGTGEILRNFTISVVGRSPGSTQHLPGAARHLLPTHPALRAGMFPVNLPSLADSLASGDDDEDSDGDSPHGDRNEEPVYRHRGQCCPRQDGQLGQVRERGASLPPARSVSGWEQLRQPPC